jgi:hypothetical protein
MNQEARFKPYFSPCPSKRQPLMHSFKTFTHSEKIAQAQRI